MRTEHQDVPMVVIDGRRYRKGSTEAKQAEASANKMKAPPETKRAALRQRGDNKHRSRRPAVSSAADQKAANAGLRVPSTYDGPGEVAGGLVDERDEETGPEGAKNGQQAAEATTEASEPKPAAASSGRGKKGRR